MRELTFIRRVLIQSPLFISNRRLLLSLYFTTTATQNQSSPNDQTRRSNVKSKEKFLTLPPYTSTISGSVVGKALSSTKAAEEATETTALKWVLKCCPQLPRNLVQKLFRLRQVKNMLFDTGDIEGAQHKLRRVAAKDLMNVGDRICLPASVKALSMEKQKFHCSEDEVNFIRSLMLYKDEAIIVVNKPPGMPVQGGIGIRKSLDELAASCLSFNYSEPPRLVHRLDRDSSGILVLGRTQLSTTVLHAVFREKTFAASGDDFRDKKRILQRKYCALVIGSPRRRNGLISAPLGKVVVDNGKSDRITVVDDAHNTSSQHAVTEYRVIESSHGYTWLELTPITGRKHQLRVHCAQVLGTPIVGDYKYGRQVHKKWKHVPVVPDTGETSDGKLPCALGIDTESGSISEKQPRLHLHCKQMVLPDISQALRGAETSSEYDLSGIKTIELDAPLPSYMQKSWNILNS